MGRCSYVGGPGSWQKQHDCDFDEGHSSGDGKGNNVKYILEVNPMSVVDSLDLEVREKVTPQFLS